MISILELVGPITNNPVKVNPTRKNAMLPGAPNLKNSAVGTNYAKLKQRGNIGRFNTGAKMLMNKPPGPHTKLMNVPLQRRVV